MRGHEALKRGREHRDRSIRFDRVGVVSQDVTEAGPVIRTILDDIDLELTADFTTVVGQNGSGKSTLLQLCNGLVRPDTGRVLVDGLDAERQVKEVRRRVGFVFTDPATQLVMPTVIEDVELSLKRSVKRRAERHERAMEVLAGLGLDDLAGRSVYELSGGQRQLVALASVLAVDPAVLILDEPTTLLDLVNERLLLDTVEGLLARGVRVIATTHNLDFARRADEAVHVADGRIAAHGPAAEVVAGYVDSVTRDVARIREERGR
ncbi:energy-coupling factor ABC transporter ATP-binding protein [Brevibacterium sp. 91QC2O2]|uniref:energy-coupling factor ABC transporter ATP-binding protein n=1 Tax=Brevibacterium sp. 91QC2O2 TaxID=2968458 RepID=UPI00211BC734|nr:ABC transporter ATP-binding protein [Brevibacterium sp. 91QC2O2]MCQ9367451.1 energy-coupling factor ABC transporter ATP-binding protein [Brevibacterium sp. 91QC2O2]